MSRKPTVSKHTQVAQHALEEAISDAVEEHRRTGTPMVIQRDGEIMLVDARELTTVRERKAKRTVGKR